MKPSIHPLSICRTPVFHYQAKIENVWEELKSYIEESSPAFFEIIKDYESHQLADLESRIKFTLWKYFNRAKFRATPYGNFAAFSLVSISKDDQPNKITITEKQIVHRFPDWSEKENINLAPAWLSKNAKFLRANTTAYICGEELRYVNFVDGLFELSEVAAQHLAIKTLEFCHVKRMFKEVKTFLSVHHALEENTINYFIEQLIYLQLLFTDFHPNITGPEYFNRIDRMISEKKDDYIIAERKVAKGQLNAKNLQVLIELTQFLGKHTPHRRNRALVDFRNSFLTKFENKEISFLKAMDPEMGISYLSFEQDTEQNNLIDELKKQVQQSPSASATQSISALQRFIIDNMLHNTAVQLADFKGEEIKQQAPVANTISALVSFSDDLIITDQVGGSTANSLLGRFTMVSDEVTCLGKDFVEIEQQANPDVLFFDIAYQAEKHVDNVNRRNSVYAYELPILTWTESINVLDLDDIMLSVIGDEIVLRSIKYGKRIIPRLASAYNYTRSDLTIFRFLSDLQHQNLHISLSANIDQVLPGLLYYPRIQYKNVVLSAAKWLVPEQLCEYKNLPFKELTDWLAGIDSQKVFKCGTGDQTLCFNMEIDEDRIAFLNYCRRKTNLYIEEAFIPVQTVVEDEHHRPYLSEFIINLEHRQQLYKSYPLRNKSSQNNEQQTVTATFLPGGEWLYFEIYCHTSRSNNLLLENINSLISTFKRKISNWFFIRYNHPENHIRLRLQLKKGTDGYAIMSLLSKIIEPHLQSGIISDLQIKSYRRETERYGAGRIHLVEKYFGIDSDCVLSILKSGFQTHQLYALSLTLIENVLNGAEFTARDQLTLAETMAASFATEMNIDGDGFKKINQSFKEFTNYGDITFINQTQRRKLFKTADTFLEVLATCGPGEKVSVSTDLFHMHVNRIFHTDQRMHEMILYHYLIRALKIRLGRQKSMNLSNG